MPQPLKEMVNEELVNDLAGRLVAEDPGFDASAFSSALVDALPDLELKPRIEAIALRMAEELDGDYRTALRTVVAVAQADPAIEGFAAWPLCTFVELFGVNDPEASLPAMEHLTQRASCEFAIRPFLIEHWEAAYAALEGFTAHRLETVRRLPSEGMRPRLPWGMRVPRLIADPEPGLALLRRLRYDKSESVRRSVANHLNDVSKDHPEVAIATVRHWAEESNSVDPRMLSHGLRTLVKRGHPGALDALGYTTDAAVNVLGFDVEPKKVAMGDRIELTAVLRSAAERAQLLVVDFIIHHVTAAGATTPKVFKWKTVELGPHDQLALAKRRRIQMASTRTYYPGPHRVELQVAGKVVAETSFDVTV